MDYQQQLTKARELKDVIMRDRQARILEAAEERGQSVGDYEDSFMERYDELATEARQIKSTGNVIFWTIIFVEVFKYSLVFVDALPVVGSALSVVLTLCIMILVVILFFVADAAEVKKIRVRGKIYARIVAVLLVHIISIIPGISLLPINLIAVIIPILLVQRERRKRLKEIEKEQKKITEHISL